MAGVKNFVADLVFSDDTMVADVVMNRPGELLRKALSTDRNLTAILNLQSWLSATYNDLRSASGNILQATKVWFYEAIFGSGKFHGDTHPQINCFIQSLVRLSNSVVEINTIMNQCKAMLEATQTMVRPPAPVDDLDLIGKIFNEFVTEEGQKLVPQPNGRQYPAYIVTLMSNVYGGATDKPGHAMFLPGGTYHTKVLNSIKNAANSLARAEELYNKLVYHADRAHNPLQDVQIENNLDPAMKKFREDWPNARTPQEKDAVIKAFTDTFARSEAGLLQYMMLYGLAKEISCRSSFNDGVKGGICGERCRNTDLRANTAMKTARADRATLSHGAGIASIWLRRGRFGFRRRRTFPARRRGVLAGGVPVPSPRCARNARDFASALRASTSTAQVPLPKRRGCAACFAVRTLYKGRHAPLRRAHRLHFRLERCPRLGLCDVRRPASWP